MLYRLIQRDFEIRLRHLEAATRLWGDAVEAELASVDGDSESYLHSVATLSPPEKSRAIWLLSGDLSHAFRASVFLSAFALVERLVVRLAESFREAQALELTVRELRETGMNGAAKYLKKVANQPFPDESDEWRRLQDYRRVRNLFAHQFGVINHSESSSRDVERAGRLKGVTVRGGEVLLEAAFLEALFATLRAFSDCLFSALEVR